jgi:hypothetical protein
VKVKRTTDVIGLAQMQGLMRRRRIKEMKNGMRESQQTLEPVTRHTHAHTYTKWDLALSAKKLWKDTPGVVMKKHTTFGGRMYSPDQCAVIKLCIIAVGSLD